MDKSGFVLRIMSVIAFSCMIMFAALVVVQVDELEKIIPDSSERSLAIFFGYVVALISFNYALGLRGGNFIGWKTESSIVLAIIFVFAGVFFPFAFPLEEAVQKSSWWGLREDSVIQEKPNWNYAWFAVIAVPFLGLVVKNLIKK